MANVRFITPAQNALRRTGALTPILVNGNAAYTGFPALIEAAPFYMANALLPDRSAAIWGVVWAGFANEGSNIVWTVDLRAATTIVAAVIHGFSHVPGVFTFGANPPTVAVEYLPGAVYSSDNANWVQAGLIALGATTARDRAASITSVSARWWRFRFFSTTFSNGFSVASFSLATAITDLGFLYARASDAVITPKSTVEGYGRTPVITQTGPPHRRFLLSYPNNDSSTRATFDALNALGGSFTYLAPDGTVHECVVDGEEFVRDHIWAPPDRFAWSFPMRSLP